MSYRTFFVMTTALMVIGALALPDAALAETGAGAAELAYAAGEGFTAQQSSTNAPRTLRAHWHVFAAFGVAWILLFGYVIWVGVRLRRAERILFDIAHGERPPSA